MKILLFFFLSLFLYMCEILLRLLKLSGFERFGHYASLRVYKSGCISLHENAFDHYYSQCTAMSQSTNPQFPESLILTNDRQYIIFTKETEQEFLTWFQTTSWYSTASATTHSVPTFSSKKKLSPIWESFLVLAHTTTGECKVECKGCGLRQDHPSTRNKGGTSSLISHLQSVRCKDAIAKKDGWGQLTLEMSLATGNVRNLFIFILISLN